MYEYVEPAPVVTDLESVLEPPIPVVHTAPAPVIEYVAPAPDVTLATPAPMIEYAAPAHTVTFTAPSPVTEDVAPAPAVTYAAPAPVIEYVAPATPETVNAYVAPAHVIEYIAPSPAVFYPSFSQQLPPFDTSEVVAVEASAPQDVGSLLPVDEHTMDIPIPRGVEAGHPRDQPLHTIGQTQQRKGGQTRGGVLETSLEVTGIDQVVWVPTRCTTSAK